MCNQCGDRYDLHLTNENGRRGFLKLGMAGLLALWGARNSWGREIDFERRGNPAYGLNKGRSLLIRGGMLVSMDNDVGDAESTDILIVDGKIRDIGKGLRRAGIPVIDAQGKIVMPGLVDTHRHIWNSILRGVGGNETLNDYIDNIDFKFGPAYRPEDMYVSAKFGALAALDSGVTSLMAWMDNSSNSIRHTTLSLQGLVESGIRGVFAYSYPYNRGAQWFEDPDLTYPGHIAEIRKHLDRLDNPFITLALGSAGPKYTSPEFTRREWEAARAANARITIHIGHADSGAERMLRDLETRFPGLLGPDVTYVHGNRFDDEELELIRKTGGTVSVSMSTETQMAMGTPLISRLLDKGMRPSFSVDSEVAVSSSLFEQMRQAFGFVRHEQGERIYESSAMAGTPNTGSGLLRDGAYVSARDILEFATLEGARANGMLETTGSLTPGKHADLIIVNPNTINMMPLNNIITALVTSTETSNVETVIVGGEVRKFKGRLLVDHRALFDEVRESRDHVFKQAGLRLDLFGTGY